MIMEKKNKIDKNATTYPKEQRGITLIALIITITIMIILVGVTVKIIIDDQITKKAENYTQAINNQVEEQESIANMVRDLYR